MGGHEIHQLLHDYGLAVVFGAVALQALCVPIPGTTVLIAAALLAAGGTLPIAGVVAAGAVGAITGTTLGFAVGRWRGEPILLWAGTRLRQTPERIHALRREFAANGRGWLFFGRFISGVRNVIGLLAGASGMPLRRFLPITAAAALSWALVNALEYYFFGRALAAADTWVQVLLVAAGLVWLVISLRFMRRRALRRLRASSPPGGPSA